MQRKFELDASQNTQTHTPQKCVSNIEKKYNRLTIWLIHVQRMFIYKTRLILLLLFLCFSVAIALLISSSPFLSLFVCVLSQHDQSRWKRYCTVQSTQQHNFYESKMNKTQSKVWQISQPARNKEVNKIAATINQNNNCLPSNMSLDISFCPLFFVLFLSNLMHAINHKLAFLFFFLCLYCVKET